MDAVYCFEQILEAAPHKTAAIQSPISKTIQVRQAYKLGTTWEANS